MNEMRETIKKVLDEYARNNFYSDNFRNHVAVEIEKKVNQLNMSKPSDIGGSETGHIPAIRNNREEQGHGIPVHSDMIEDQKIRLDQVKSRNVPLHEHNDKLDNVISGVKKAPNDLPVDDRKLLSKLSKDSKLDIVTKKAKSNTSSKKKTIKKKSRTSNTKTRKKSVSNR